MTDDKKPPKSPRNNPWGDPKKPTKRRKTTITSGGDGKELEQIISMSREKLQRIRRGGGGRGSKGRGSGTPEFSPKSLVGVLVVLCLLWLASGFFRVQPGENAVVLRFGEIVQTRTEPGWGWHIPTPIESLDKLNVSVERRLPIGFDGSGRDVSSESMMLTGDENIIDIDFVVLWNIKDPVKYLYNIRAPEQTLKVVAESAMREVIAKTKLEEALAPGREKIEVATQEVMQSIMDDFGAGISVNGVEMQPAKPPEAVNEAFNEVLRAQADRERYINEAQSYSNDIIPRAEGQAIKLLEEARAYSEQVVSKAQGEADRFDKVYDSYRKAQKVTETRMYIETMEDVLSKADVTILDEAVAKGAVPILPLGSNAAIKLPEGK